MRRNIHLTIDARLINAAGHGRYLKHLFQAFSSEDFKLSLLHSPQDDLSTYSKSLIPINSPIFSMEEQWELPLKIPSCDLFWSPHFNVPLLPIRAKKRVVTLHDTFHLSHPKLLNFMQKCYAHVFYRMSVQLSDLLLTVSQAAKKEMERHLHPKSCVVVPNSVSLPQGEVDVRKKFNLPKKFLLAVGNMKAHKNILRLIEAYELLDIEEELVLVGPFSMQFPSKKRIHALRFVTDEELTSLYTLASSLVFPSLYEGFGWPPLEALLCGCPVVASSIPSIVETCEDEVEYCDPYDVSSIAEAIKRGVLARKEPSKRVLEKYNFQNWQEKMKEIVYACCNCS